VIRERNQFVWILSYAGREDWAAQEAAYHNSPERRALDPDPGQYVAGQDRWFLTPVLSDGADPT